MIKIPEGMSLEGASLVADADEGMISWDSVERRLSEADTKLFYGKSKAELSAIEREEAKRAAAKPVKPAEPVDVAAFLKEALKDWPAD